MSDALRAEVHNIYGLVAEDMLDQMNAFLSGERGLSAAHVRNVMAEFKSVR